MNLDAIKARCAAVETHQRWCDSFSSCMECARLKSESSTDVPALVAEVERLRAALDAHQSPEAAYSLALKAIEQSQRANRAEAALAAERRAAAIERGSE